MLLRNRTSALSGLSTLRSCRIVGSLSPLRASAVPSPASALAGLSSRRFQSGYRKEKPPANIGFVIVPQQKAYVVERLGRYHATLSPGLHFLIPIIDQVSYVHSLKEDAITIASQTAVTRDNVVLSIDGVLYMRIVDPVKASYGVSDAHYALTQLAQTTMRSELGKLTLDKTFQERDHLNVMIVAQINAAAANWGTEVLRYEIKDITPPSGVRAAMEMQAEAERRKRAQVLESEGNRDSQINNAEGLRRSAVLEAQGEAEAAVLRSRATAAALQVVGTSIASGGGADAVSLRLAEQYIAAFGRLAKAGNTLVLPANAGDAASMVGQALAVFSTVRAGNAGGGSAVGAAAPSPGGPRSVEDILGSISGEGSQDLDDSRAITSELADAAEALIQRPPSRDEDSVRGDRGGFTPSSNFATPSPSAPATPSTGGGTFIPQPF